MEKTIITYINRIRQSFRRESIGQSPEFVRGGRVALEVAEQKFQETSLANYLLELNQAQDELETVSDQLLRAKEQNRLQQLEIERLEQLTKGRPTLAAHQHSLSIAKKACGEKLRFIAVSLAIGKQRLGFAPPTESERVQQTLIKVGAWLQHDKDAGLTVEEQEVAALFAKMPRPSIDKLSTLENTPVQKLALPLNASQRQQLDHLNKIMARRSKYEKQEDRALTLLAELVTRPNEDIWHAAGDNPVLRDFIKQWESVSGRLQWLVEEAPQLDTIILSDQ